MSGAAPQFIEADEAEKWVLATGLPGLVDATSLDAQRALNAELDRLRGRIAELEARRDALAQEIDVQIECAHAAAIEAAGTRVACALTALGRRGAALIEAAADAAVRVAETVIRDRVRADPALLRTLVRDAIARRVSVAPLAVRVAPSFERALADGLASTGIRVVPDPALHDGDCVLDYVDGQIDLRLERVLEHMRSPVRDALLQGATDGG